MVAYFSSVWAGTENPLWPHLVLIPVSVIAAFAVGFGIKFESSKYSCAVHKVATRLVLGGIAVEALCTVLLFVVDERISNAQQEKIISLEARPWTEEQFDAIQELRGKVKDVGIIIEKNCMECEMFAINLMSALNAAGIQMYEPTRETFAKLSGVGLLVLLPKGDDLITDPLVTTLRKVTGPVVAGRPMDTFRTLRDDIRIIFVGGRGVPSPEPVFRPGGNAQWKMLPLEK